MKTYRHGARIAPKQFRNGKFERIEIPLPSPPPDPTAYNLAAANLHKPWARRWMRSLAIQHRTSF